MINQRCIRVKTRNGIKYLYELIKEYNSYINYIMFNILSVIDNSPSMIPVLQIKRSIEQRVKFMISNINQIQYLKRCVYQNNLVNSLYSCGSTADSGVTPLVAKLSNTRFR